MSDTSHPTIDAWGLQHEWLDADDQPHQVPEATITRLREVIGEAPDDLDDTAPVVTRPGRRTGLRGRVVCEDGSERDLDDVVPDDLPLGYHRLTTQDGERLLVVSPGRCHVPAEQAWGWSVQLYAVWSARSAGIGDLGDLRALREWTESLGGGFLVINPLHAVAPVPPLESSPYLPATRRFRNPVYLSLADVPGCRPGGDAPAAGVVDRDAAWGHKIPRCERCGTPACRATTRPGWRRTATSRAGRWRSSRCGACWPDEHGADFRDWPEELRDPTGPAVAEVARERAGDVGFWAWLQWLLAEQLAAAGGSLTVVQDLPIGVSGGGADAWVWQDVLAGPVTVGAPPGPAQHRGPGLGLAAAGAVAAACARTTARSSSPCGPRSRVPAGCASTT